MKRIIAKRGTGKTKQLLEYAWTNGAIVVCSNPLAMSEKAKAYGFFGMNFIDYKEYYFRTHEDDNINKKYVVDELENLLIQNVIGYTITNED